MYTIKNKSVDQITCDNNGAYNNSRSNSKDFYVDIEDNQVKECKMVHKEGNLLYYNRRCSSRSYEKVYIDREKVYCIKRYYKHNKSVPGLRLMIVKLFVNSIEHPITCVVYHKSTDDKILFSFLMVIQKFFFFLFVKGTNRDKSVQIN